MTTLPKAAWDRGKSLSAALETFSSDDLWQEFEPLHEKFTETIPTDFPHEKIKLEPQPLLELSPTEEFPKYLALLERLKSEIVVFLRTGKLLGVGFLRPKNRGAEPRWISADYWNDGYKNKISWENSELWSDGKVFTDVRVVRPQVPITIGEGADNQNIQLAPSPSRKRPGRPSLASEIKAAYDELKSEGKIDFGSIGANVSAIKFRVCSRAGLDPTSTKGLEYDAIRKVITTDFRKDKTEHKSLKSPS